MKKMNILFKLSNNDETYEYKDEASKINNVIAFKDNNTFISYNIETSELIKKDDEKKLIIDFKGKTIKIITNEFETSLPINVSKRNIIDNRLNIVYEIENNKFNLLIETDGGFYD